MSIIALALSAVVNFTVTLLAFIRGRKNKLLRSFGLLTLCILFWNLGSLGLWLIKDLQVMALWSKILRVGLYFLPSSLLYFSLLFSHSYKKRYINLIRLNFLISGLNSLTNFLSQTSFINSGDKIVPLFDLSFFSWLYSSLF